MTVPTDPADQAANEAQAKKELNVDASKPTTTIQIRLVDGSTVKVQFNLTHTVSDIRRYIITYPFLQVFLDSIAPFGKDFTANITKIDLHSSSFLFIST